MSQNRENFEKDNENSSNRMDGVNNKIKGVGEAAAGQLASTVATSAMRSGATASSSASAGVAAGTTVGGPAGTVVGAVVGMLASKLATPAMGLVKFLILIVAFITMIFQLLPSMLWENPSDLFSDTASLEVYNKYHNYALNKYEMALQRCINELEGIHEKQINEILEDEEYDNVVITYGFSPNEEVFRSQFLESSALLVTMFEVGNDNWKNASFDDFTNKVDRVDFWHTLVVANQKEEKRETERNGDEKTLKIHYTYSLSDTSISHFRKEFGTEDEAPYLRAIEMSYHTRLFFGEINSLPMGGITSSGGRGSNTTFPGGYTHDLIRSELAALEEKMVFVDQECIVPLPSDSWIITSQFGPRNFPPDPLHTGLDFGVDQETPIYAVMDGIVLLRLWSPNGFGNHIVIYHGGNITTMYAHMVEFGNYQVGDKVKQGDTIGFVGNTGLSTNPHLHLEYQINGAAYNPKKYLRV